jgi:hypothetical protein
VALAKEEDARRTESAPTIVTRYRNYTSAQRRSVSRHSYAQSRLNECDDFDVEPDVLRSIKERGGVTQGSGSRTTPHHLCCAAAKVRITD